MVDPALYNLSVNAIYVVANAATAAILIYAGYRSDFKNLALTLLTCSILLSIATSSANTITSTIRLSGDLLENRDLLKLLFRSVTVCEPISMLLFYSGLIIFALNIVKTRREMK